MLFRAKKAGTVFLAAGPLLGWDGLLTGAVVNYVFACDHFTMMAEPAIAEIGGTLNRMLTTKES